jgi:hypothetical protein
VVAAQAQVVAAKDAELQRRADAFRAQIEARLKDVLLPDGAQVLSATAIPAVVATLPLAGRPRVEDVEATLDALRRDPTVIDLRVVAEPARAIELSLLAGSDGDDGARAQRLLRDAANPGMRTAIGAGAAGKTRAASAVRLDLRTLEDPLDRHPSPITRWFVDPVLGWMLGRHDPERRLRAIGRGVRREGWIAHASAGTVAGDARAVRITALVETVPDGFRTGTTSADAKADKPRAEELPSAAVLSRFAALGEADAQRATGLYAVAVRAAKEGRMTIARPVLGATYGKKQFDYLAGYLAVFVVQILGVGVIFIFLYMVKTGRVTKRGVAEAEATR